jgi:hypothetical protein
MEGWRGGRGEGRAGDAALRPQADNDGDDGRSEGNHEWGMTIGGGAIASGGMVAWCVAVGGTARARGGRGRRRRPSCGHPP